jgi:phosphatidate cytidylyltransferase
VPKDDDATRQGDSTRVPDKEGVRIIGAEEAAEALERDDVAQRRGDDEPKFGDRPESPKVAEPRTTIRFPLDADESPESSATALPAPPPAAGSPGDPSLPHWTDPPTGELPRIFAAEDLEDDASTWSSFTSGQPRWRGEGPERHDDLADFSRLADDETRIGALADDDRPDPEDWFALDEDDDRWDEAQSPRVGGPAAAVGEEDDWLDEGAGAPQTRPISSTPRRAGAVRSSYDRPSNAGRDVPLAVGVGVAFAAIALIAFAAGPRFAVALVVVVLAVAAAELFNVLRQAGYQPATLLGLAACVALPLAGYWKGEGGLPVVLFLTVVFGMLWYLIGAGGNDRPVIGLSSTLLGVGYVGLLGSFAALMLALPDSPLTDTADPGIGVLLGAVIATVGYDVFGFVIGRNAGSRPLSAASPNKTIEGLVGGMLGAVLVSILVTFAALRINPWTEFGDALLLGLAVAVAAPLGDLCESLLKRDLDVKDMGSLLPGHGGFLDRFDALLFVLPTVYYLARVLLY